MFKKKSPTKSILKFDMINRSLTRNFTQIPNDLLRDPNISSKSKVLLCILLSNKEGWKSYLTTLCNMMKEGKTTIRSGLKELIELGYLLKPRYRCKKTKQIKGSIWLYTDIPHSFKNMDEVFEMIDKSGFELYPGDIQTKNLEHGNLNQGKLNQGNQPLIILTSNNTDTEDDNTKETKKEVKKKKLSNGFNSSLKTKKINNKKTKKVKEYIKPKDFDMWWKLYPRKIQKGKAKTLWNKICNRQEKENTPTLKKIIRSVLKQSKTKQWLENKGKYIPHPSTWLNQMRWLDDSAKMKSWDNNYNSNKSGKVKPRYKGVGRSEIENIAAERDTLIWDDI